MATVLLVDDMLAVRALLRVYLMGFKLDFAEAGNGAEALALARANPPVLIITDIQMPVMGGLELLEAVRGDPRLERIPVIILSSDEKETAKLRRLKPRHTFIAVKPIELEALKGAVREALGT